MAYVVNFCFILFCIQALIKGPLLVRIKVKALRSIC